MNNVVKQKPSLYKILDLDPTASQREIAGAADKLAREWDPSAIEDRKNRVIVASVLREIIEARDVLMDPQKRMAYDVGLGLAEIIYKEDTVKKSRSTETGSHESSQYTGHLSISANRVEESQAATDTTSSENKPTEVSNTSEGVENADNEDKFYASREESSKEVESQDKTLDVGEVKQNNASSQEIFLSTQDITEPSAVEKNDHAPSGENQEVLKEGMSMQDAQKVDVDTGQSTDSEFIKNKETSDSNSEEKYRDSSDVTKENINNESASENESEGFQVTSEDSISKESSAQDYKTDEKNQETFSSEDNDNQGTYNRKSNSAEDKTDTGAENSKETTQGVNSDSKNDQTASVSICASSTTKDAGMGEMFKSFNEISDQSEVREVSQDLTEDLEKSSHEDMPKTVFLEINLKPASKTDSVVKLYSAETIPREKLEYFRSNSSKQDTVEEKTKDTSEKSDEPGKKTSNSSEFSSKTESTQTDIFGVHDDYFSKVKIQKLFADKAVGSQEVFQFAKNNHQEKSSKEKPDDQSDVKDDKDARESSFKMKREFSGDSSESLNKSSTENTSETQKTSKKCPKSGRNKEEPSKENSTGNSSDSIKSQTSSSETDARSEKTSDDQEQKGYYHVCQRRGRKSETFSDWQTSSRSKRTKSVSASTRSGGSETKTVYSYSSDSEKIEVFVDGLPRLQAYKESSADAYTTNSLNTNYQSLMSSSSQDRFSSSTSINANGAKIETLRICDGNEETISIHKDGVLICKISNSSK